MKLKNADVHFGQVQYIPKQDAVPTTTKTEGNVAIKKIGSPERPAYFKVTFVINSDFTAGHAELRNSLYLDVVVLDKKIDAEYREIEDEAAQQLAPMLRAVAQKLEDDERNRPA